MATFFWYHEIMRNIGSFIKDLLEVIIVSIIIVFLCFKFVFISAQVDGTSMYPTLIEGDRGFSFVITRNIGIKRYDICVIRPENSKRLLVKRVIGMPNETIEFKDNVLYINGVKQNEDFLTDTYTEDLIVTLADDEYYCLGDNRVVSKDSRYYGPFKEEQIISTGYFVFFPFDRFGIKS